MHGLLSAFLLKQTCDLLNLQPEPIHPQNVNLTPIQR